MADSPLNDHDRLDELLALREVGNLSLEEQAELDALLPGALDHDRYDALSGRLTVMLDEASGESDSLPKELAASVAERGRGIVGRGVTEPVGMVATTASQPSAGWTARGGWLMAAVIAIGAGIGLVFMGQQQARQRAGHDTAIAEARQQIEENSRIIEASRVREASMRTELAGLEDELRQSAASLAEERSERLDLASRLAEASAALDAAELRIARFETPIDPATIRANRRKLLDVPGTVRLAWQPFEVVQRMLADPGSKTYGALSVQVQARAQGTFVLQVPPEAFVPPPKVQSAVVRLELKPVPEVGSVTPEQFDKVVRAAFAQRRKTLLNALGAVYGRDEASIALRRASVDEGARAATVDVAGYRRIADALYGEPPPAQSGTAG